MNRGYNYELRKAYKNVFNSLGVNIYDYWAEDDAALPYIIIGDIFSNDDRNKCDNVENCSVVLQIISAYRGQGGRQQADQIADDIQNNKNALRTQLTLVDPGFVCADVYKINDLTTREQTATHKTYRRIITLGHIITQQ